MIPRPLTPAEFDRIATERGYVKVSEATSPDLYRQWAEDNGYVKRPACEACEGVGEVAGSALPGVVAPAPCPSCDGSGFGRLVAAAEAFEAMEANRKMGQRLMALTTIDVEGLREAIDYLTGVLAALEGKPDE